MTDRIHHGRNIKRFREMLDLKQEELAYKLGQDWNQKKVSLLEAKEEVEPDLLQQVSKALDVPLEALKNMRDDTAVSVISSTFNDHSIGAVVNNHQVFNPIDKLMETIEENKRLYTALLKEKDEKIALLERLLAEKK